MLSKSNYLDLMGITQWQLRAASPSLVLIPHQQPQAAKWLFILEKQEVSNDLSLLSAIAGAIKQTLASIAIAYFDTTTNKDLVLQSPIRYIVVMGNDALQHFKANTQFSPDIPVIISANLTELANNTSAKRTLWQQLKQYQD